MLTKLIQFPLWYSPDRSCAIIPYRRLKIRTPCSDLSAGNTPVKWLALDNPEQWLSLPHLKSSLSLIKWWLSLLQPGSFWRRNHPISHQKIDSRTYSINLLTLMLLVANLANTKSCKKAKKNDWNPDKWVLIWEYSVRAFQWIPTWQGLDGFQKSLHSCALDESSLSIERVNTCRG